MRASAGSLQGKRFARAGDCEDYAILKYHTLRDMGVPEKDMSLLMYADRKEPENNGHIALAVRRDSQVYVMDNLYGDNPEGPPPLLDEHMDFMKRYYGLQENLLFAINSNHDIKDLRNQLGQQMETPGFQPDRNQPSGP